MRKHFRYLKIDLIQWQTTGIAKIVTGFVRSVTFIFLRRLI